MEETRRIEIGINTFGLGPVLTGDEEGTFRKLKEYGADAIEPCIMFTERSKPLLRKLVASQSEIPIIHGIWPSDTASKRIQILRKMGLKVYGFHMMAPKLTPEIARQAAVFAKVNELSYAVYSGETDKLSRAEKLLPGLRACIKEFHSFGLDFMYHNHAREWTETNGTYVLEYLMKSVPELAFQIDLGWAEYAGRDCIEMMDVYKDRIHSLHYKDFFPDARHSDRRHCFSAVGEGILPIAKIAAKAKELSLPAYGYVIDQDSSREDMLRDLRVGIQSIREGEAHIPHAS